MRERVIERYLCEQTAKAGGIAFKWSSPGTAGVADRLLFFPPGLVVVVECKAPGKEPTALQRRHLKSLRSLGFIAEYVDSHETVDALLHEVQRQLRQRREHHS